MKTRANKAVAKVAFGALALNAAFPALAFAAEAEQEGGISAILPDMAEFIPMLIAFIILWIILAKFGWPMFGDIIFTAPFQKFRTDFFKSSSFCQIRFIII